MSQYRHFVVFFKHIFLVTPAQNTINNVLIILKYYIHICAEDYGFLNLEGGLEFQKYAINIVNTNNVIYVL